MFGNECCKCVNLDPDMNTGTKLYLLSDSRADIGLLKSKNSLGTMKFEPREKIRVKNVVGTIIETHGSIKATVREGQLEVPFTYQLVSNQVDIQGDGILG